MQPKYTPESLKIVPPMKSKEEEIAFQRTKCIDKQRLTSYYIISKKKGNLLLPTILNQ